VEVLSEHSIKVRGARVHNLAGVSVDIPRNRLVVLSGVSGSGKSSFAFDTLYAEGQRRYIESLSAYARQFLGQMDKPDYDSIEGLSPAIAIEQKTVSHNPRSTVGTVTEIADYLRVLFARAGEPHCHVCGRPVSSQTVQQMTDAILRMPGGTRIMVAAPVVMNRKGARADLLTEIRRKGFVRVILDGEVTPVEDLKHLDPKKRHSLMIVVDRLQVGPGVESRLSDSVETAVKEGEGVLAVIDADTGEETLMSEKSACVKCGVSMPELTPQLFSFNNPAGMCRSCSGLGFQLRVDPALVIPRPALSIKDGAVAPWGIPHGWVSSALKSLAREYGFNPGMPWKRLPQEVKDLILHGSGDRPVRFDWQGTTSQGSWTGPFEGVIPRLQRLQRSTSSEGAREQYEKYFRRYTCEDCGGSRLRPESRAVLFSGVSIAGVSSMTVGEADSFFSGLILDEGRAAVASGLLKEIGARLGFLRDVGLHYLALDRPAPTLAGGEAQRIRLASQIGSGLTGVLYVLDEPTVGLHPRDTARLVSTLEHLRDLDNTVLVVEHDPDTLLKADHILDFGPGAGTHGGKLVAQGTPEEIMNNPDSITGDYLSGRKTIVRLATPRKKSHGSLRIRGASLHNLKSVDLSIPLGKMVCVTGVSGSGKSSLITQTLYPALASALGTGSASLVPGPFRDMTGVEQVDKVICISQDPIGRTPRSNPATYTKAFDSIRSLFAELPESKVRGYKPGRFSFNVKGGRCEDCGGAGVKRIEMHFLPDVYVECETCRGLRFNRETLRVKFRDYSISDVLNLTVDDAMALFERIPQVYSTIRVLADVGLGYIRLGQPATTLSGGEAQRVKLARELARPSTTHTLYILDEPTTGLHPHDVNRLLLVLDRLVGAGNTVLVIEHNLDVVRNADWIVDLGPEGGDGGGRIIAAGTPEEIATHPDSPTGKHLAGAMERAGCRVVG
jgi:excinuclease ABC subunit A